MLVYTFDKSIFNKPYDIFRMDAELKRDIGSKVQRSGYSQVDALIADIHKHKADIASAVSKVGGKIRSRIVAPGMNLNPQGTVGDRLFAAAVLKPQFTMHALPYSLTVHEHYGPRGGELVLQLDRPKGPKVLARSS